MEIIDLVSRDCEVFELWHAGWIDDVSRRGDTSHVTKREALQLVERQVRLAGCRIESARIDRIEV